MLTSRVRDNPSTTIQTGTATSGTGVTLSLSGVGGQFHYITLIVIMRFAAAALTAAATPVIITTTNLPGSLAFSVDAAAAAQGTIFEQRVELGGNPLKSSAAGTVSTIVAPGTTNVIWRLTAYYYTDT